MTPSTTSSLSPHLRCVGALRAWSTRRVAVVLAILGGVGLLLLDGLIRDEPRPQDDDRIYEEMAEHPSAPHTYVFAFRVAVPWLVHVLPFDHTFSFSVIAWVCSGAAAGVLFALLERLGIPRTVSIPLAMVLAVSPPLLVASLRQGRNPDPLTILVMVTGAFFIVDRNPLPLALTMLVGALNRESALFLAPLAYAVWAERIWDPIVFRRVAVAVLPAMAAFVALRLTMPTVGREAVPGYGSVFGGRVEVIREALSSPGLELRRLITVYGPLWLVAPLAFRGFWFARRGLVLVGLCMVACTFALDWGRIAFIAAPIAYASAAWTLSQHPRSRFPVFVACAALVVGYAVYMQTVGVQNLIDAGPPPYPVR